MTTIAGADGCKSGWICLFLELETGRLGSKILESTASLLDQAEHVSVLAIDIPIGLTDAGPRECDVAARRMLRWPRAASVFPAPIRPALAATTYAAGLQIAIKAQVPPDILHAECVAHARRNDERLLFSTWLTAGSWP